MLELALSKVRNAAKKAWGRRNGRATPWCWPRHRQRAGILSRDGPGTPDAGILGRNGIEVQGTASTFSGDLEEPGIATSPDPVTVEGAGATFRAPLQEP